MNNVMLDPLPNFWNGYLINTDFRIGIQLSLLIEDDEITEQEKIQYAIYLLFSNEDNNIRTYPTDNTQMEKCIEWFLNGWNKDKRNKSQTQYEKILDYNIDQGRIYADFRSVYHINLNTENMHWWEFCWLLWNMTREQSSFIRVIEIRTKKPDKHSTSEQIKAIKEAKEIFGLNKKNKYSSEQEAMIDEYDRQMAERRKKGEP